MENTFEKWMFLLNRKVFFLLIPFIVNALPCIIVAEINPAVDIEESYYTVTGKNVADIRRSLNRNSPIRVRGRNYDAYTNWNITWNLRYAYTSDKCAITNVVSTLSINHILPRLTSSIAGDLQHKWLKYYDALLQHEKGHQVLAMEAAVEIQRSLAALAPQVTCTELEKKANVLGSTIINRYIEKEKDFDRTSRHGAVYGATFP